MQAGRDWRLLRESTLGGPQGRFVLTYLVSERKRAVTQGELAEALWPESLPASWTVALSAIISRLRSRLATLGLVRSHIIGNAFGCYQFSAPADTWVDLEAALAGVDAAEGFIAAGNPSAACGRSLTATPILARPFLAGDMGARGRVAPGPGCRCNRWSPCRRHPGPPGGPRARRRTVRARARGRRGRGN